jgi:phosphorylcholine metabolism protein LicD
MCEVEEFHEMMEFLDSLWTPLGIRWSLAFGTLLGAIRQGEMNSGDSDVDISVDMKDIHVAEFVLNHAIKATGKYYWVGCNPITKTSNTKTVRRLNYSKKNLIHIDVWLHNITDTPNSTLYLRWQEAKLAEGVTANVTQQYFVFPTEVLKPTRLCEYGGRKYPCPNQAEVIFEAMYGDYLVPHKSKKADLSILRLVKTPMVGPATVLLKSEMPEL